MPETLSSFSKKIPRNPKNPSFSALKEMLNLLDDFCFKEVL